MSSLARRIQIRLFEKAGARRVPVLDELTGNVKAWRWPRRIGQLAFAASGVALFPGSKHQTLQPIIDILEENARRTAAAAA